jgi:hypothetical protein
MLVLKQTAGQAYDPALPRVVVLTEDQVVLGRSAGGAAVAAAAAAELGTPTIVRLASTHRNMVSRNHLKILRQRDEHGAPVYRLLDLASVNGTAVNGRRVLDARLHDGDVVVIGGCHETPPGQALVRPPTTDLVYTFYERVSPLTADELEHAVDGQGRPYTPPPRTSPRRAAAAPAAAAAAVGDEDIGAERVVRVASSPPPARPVRVVSAREAAAVVLAPPSPERRVRPERPSAVAALRALRAEPIVVDVDASPPAPRHPAAVIEVADDDDAPAPASAPAPAPGARGGSTGAGTGEDGGALAEQLEDVLECVVCREYLCLPHTLDCGHVFCKGCLIGWLKST